jgi:hypothetical protein
MYAAFVHFADERDAKDAVRKLDGKQDPVRACQLCRYLICHFITEC